MLLKFSALRRSIDDKIASVKEKSYSFPMNSIDVKFDASPGAGNIVMWQKNKNPPAVVGGFCLTF
jgi:hypothetical protein